MQRLDEESEQVVWARRLQAIAQTGLTYSTDVHDTERYEEIGRLAAEILAQGDTRKKDLLVEIFQREEGYATPKVDTRGAVFRDSKLLMVQEAADGGWTLPGGWADPGESPSENVRREVLEETGFEVRVRKLLAIYDRAKHPHVPVFPFHVYKLFFWCEITGGEVRGNHEITDLGFFGENEIPDLSISRVTSHQIRRMFEHLQSPDLATDFD